MKKGTPQYFTSLTLSNSINSLKFLSSTIFTKLSPTIALHNQFRQIIDHHIVLFVLCFHAILQHRDTKRAVCCDDCCISCQDFFGTFQVNPLIAFFIFFKHLRTTSTATQAICAATFQLNQFRIKGLQHFTRRWRCARPPPRRTRPRSRPCARHGNGPDRHR